MKIAILGFGLEGKSLLKFLQKSPQFKKADISILDKKFDKNYLKNLERFDIVFRSPGVPYNLPEIQKAIRNGTKFSSGTKLFFEEVVRRGSPQVIGITGTKGKGTTSTLLYKILKAAGKDAYLAGNIGKPAIEILPKLKNNSIVILELSSFQLWDFHPHTKRESALLAQKNNYSRYGVGVNHSPDITVVLDIFPDHLDSHKNFSEYLNAKTNIAKWQRKTDKIFYFSDNKYSKLVAQKSPAKKIAVNSEHSNKFANLDYILKIPGRHNLKNAIMATTVASSLGCPKNKIITTVKNFHGNEHRLELIRTIHLHSGCVIKFYNDSASTNPQTAAAAIRAFPNQPKILIAGGKDKNLDYSPLAQALKNSDTKLIILFGENKKKIKYQVSSIKCQIKLVKDLKSAVQLAYKTAKSLIAKPYNLNPIIIFSPASASFDMFRDYKERGKKFKEIVKKLK